MCFHRTTVKADSWTRVVWSGTSTGDDTELADMWTPIPAVTVDCFLARGGAGLTLTPGFRVA